MKLRIRLQHVEEAGHVSAGQGVRKALQRWICSSEPERVATRVRRLAFLVRVLPLKTELLSFSDGRLNNDRLDHDLLRNFIKLLEDVNSLIAYGEQEDQMIQTKKEEETPPSLTDTNLEYENEEYLDSDDMD